MRIRKIQEIISTEGVITKTQQYHLIIDEKDEGWELSTEELIQVKQIIEEALKLTAYIAADFSKVLDLTAIELVHDDQSADCQDYIEPPEISTHDEAIRFLPNEITESSVDKQPSKEKPENSSSIERDYKPYIDMMNLWKKPSDVIKKMESDLQIGNGTARTYYYKNIHPYKDPDVTTESDDPDAAKDPEEESRLPKSLAKKIADMPAYQTAREFVDATILQDIGQNKEVWELKAMYLKSHPHIKWR